MSSGWFYSLDVDEMAKWDEIKVRVQYRNQIVQTIGNLTIVTQPLNAALSNGPFNTKKGELMNSSLMLNRYFHNIAEWNEKSIEDRAKYLLQYASNIWPYPGRHDQ